MRRDIARSPWGAAAFAAALLMLIFLTIDRLGVFAPGPVLQGLVMHATVNADETVSFRVEGTKTTNDVMRSRVASWLYSDGTSSPAAIDAPQPTQIRLTGDHFLSQTYTVPIPPAARTDAGSRLRVCFVYDPGLSCTEVRLQAIAG